MLKCLQEYVMKDSYDDHPVYEGFRYRDGGVISVERGDRIITLEKITMPDDMLAHLSESNRPWLAQLVTDDDRNGKKIRVYPSEVATEGQVPPTPRVTSTSTGISSFPWPTYWVQVERAMQQTGAPPYVNTADSILREEDDV